MAQQPTGWHVEDIKAALRKRFGSLNELAADWGLHRGAISAVLNRPHYSTPVELRIAKAIGFPPQVIWPDRWHPDGTPVRRYRTGKSAGGNGSRTGAGEPHRQKATAA